MGKDEVRPLTYDPAAGWIVPRRSYRLLVFLTFINTILLTGYLLGPKLWEFGQQRYAIYQQRQAEQRAIRNRLALQQQCLDHRDPPDMVIYEEDPQRARELAQRPNYEILNYRPPRPALPHPPVLATGFGLWDQFLDASEHDKLNTGDVRPLFLSARQNPQGAERLVSVSFRAAAESTTLESSDSTQIRRFRRIYVRVMVPGTEQQPATESYFGQTAIIYPEPDVTYDIGRDGKPINVQQTAFRLHSGQRDPQDPTRFSIPYVWNGRARCCMDNSTSEMRSSSPPPPAFSARTTATRRRANGSSPGSLLHQRLRLRREDGRVVAFDHCSFYNSQHAFAHHRAR
jgi:hypothetical protein